MTIDLVVSGCIAIMGVAVAWGVVKTKVSDLKDEMEKLEQWKDRHSELDMTRLRDVEKEMSEIRGMISVSAEQYKEIIRRLTIIEAKMEDRRQLFNRPSREDET